LRAEWSNVTQVGALQTAPILIAVITAFLAMEGVKYLIGRRQRLRRARLKEQHSSRSTHPPSIPVVEPDLGAPFDSNQGSS
jgi:hypothetical protein